MGIRGVSKKARQSNIELLRILAIMGVIILHYNNSEIGGGLTYAVQNSTNHYILAVLESFFVCAVDLFVLISGYFMVNSSKRGLTKPIELIVQVILYKLGFNIVNMLLHGGTISGKILVASFIPDNYFVILYIALYFVSMYINLIIKELSDKEIKQLVVLAFALFSIWPFMVDVFNKVTSREWIGLSTIGIDGSQRGYSIVNFMLLYLLGAYIRNKGVEHVKVKSVPLIIGLVGLVGLISIWSEFDENTAWEYCSPFVICEAMILFVLFSRMHIRENIIINKLAKAAFSVFLLHTYFLPYINIEDFV